MLDVAQLVGEPFFLSAQANCTNDAELFTLRRRQHLDDGLSCPCLIDLARREPEAVGQNACRVRLQKHEEEQRKPRSHVLTLAGRRGGSLCGNGI